MLAYHNHLVKISYIVNDMAEGILLLFPTSALSYDHQKYGEYKYVAMPVADSPRVMEVLLEHVPNTNVVFKLIHENDESLVSARFKGTRVRSFLNFSTTNLTQLSPDSEVRISSHLNDGLIEAFGKNGHTPGELIRFFADGGQALSINDEAGQSLSVGMLYRNFNHIWEVAALFTIPSARRKGYSARIVRTALYILRQLGYQPRFVVDDTNIPSIRLAQKVGLERFLRVFHITTNGRR